MLSLFSKRQINIGFILILISLLILQGFTCQFPVDIDVWKNSAPLAHSLFLLLGENILQNVFFDFFTSTLLILFQLILVYNIINRIKNLEKYAVLSTWIYCWLIHIFPVWSKLSPTLISLSILMFILYRIYKSVDATNNHFIFVTSTLIGISFLLWYPSILLLAFTSILLFQYNAISIKRILIILLSFSIPIIWFIAFYILRGEHLSLIYKFSTFHITSIRFNPLGLYQYLALLIILGFVTFGFFQAMSIGTKTAKLSRLFINSLLSLVIFLALGFLISTNEFHYSFMPLLFPFALFLTFFINIFKRPRIAELVHFTILLCVLVNFVAVYRL